MLTSESIFWSTVYMKTHWWHFKVYCRRWSIFFLFSLTFSSVWIECETNYSPSFNRNISKACRYSKQAILLVHVSALEYNNRQPLGKVNALSTFFRISLCFINKFLSSLLASANRWKRAYSSKCSMVLARDRKSCKTVRKWINEIILWQLKLFLKCKVHVTRIIVE